MECSFIVIDNQETIIRIRHPNDVTESRIVKYMFLSNSQQILDFLCPQQSGVNNTSSQEFGLKCRKNSWVTFVRYCRILILAAQTSVSGLERALLGREVVSSSPARVMATWNLRLLSGDCFLAKRSAFRKVSRRSFGCDCKKRVPVSQQPLTGGKLTLLRSECHE